MGRKVHPIGFRIGVIRDWQSKWYSEAHYAEFVQEDNKLRKTIMTKYPDAAISLIEIDRQAKDITITLHTARPGIVIGRGGQRVDEMRQFLEGLIGKKIRLNIQEIRQPELDAYLVAKSVAEQIERRVAYRRAMKQAIFRTIQSGAKGIKISAAGRLANAEIARRQTLHEGQVPLHTLRADVDYGFTEARTTLGRIGVKVWIYKGQILPELKITEEEAKPAEAAAEPAEAPATEEKPTEVKEKPAEVEEKPTEAEEKEVAEAEEKPAKEVAAAEVKEKPAKTTKAAPAKAEEKPAKPKAKKAVKKAEAKEPAAKVTKKKATKAKATKTKAEEEKKEIKTAKAEKAKASETKTKAKAAKTEKAKAAPKKTPKKAAATETKKAASKKTKTVAKSKKEEKDAAA